MHQNRFISICILKAVSRLALAGTASARSQWCREAALSVYPICESARKKDKLLTDILGDSNSRGGAARCVSV